MNGEAAKEQLCAVCKVKASQKCSGCKSVVYCGRDHQRRHWKDHSANCKPIKLSTNSKLGRHYVASRRIDVGEIVIRDEVPLVAGPMSSTVPVCLGCYVVLTADSALACLKCGWPLCGTCREHGPECEFTQRRRLRRQQPGPTDADDDVDKVSITEFEHAHPTYRCVCVVRALCLRESDPEAYRKLLDLEDHCDSIDKLPCAALNEPRDVARFVRRFFRIEDVSEEEIARIVGIIQVNGHEVPTTEPPYVAVYDRASFLEHSCRANCSKSFNENGGIAIRAMLPIAKGEHVSICYTDPLWGVRVRRHHLMQTKFFDCTCERCSDPTELGTMFNAMKCIESECVGHMLPPSFLHGQEDLPNYACDKCDSTVSSEQVESTLRSVGIELASMKKNDVVACESFLGRHASVLHENHFYNTDAKIALAQIIGQQTGGLPAIGNELLGKKILLCQKLNDLLRIIVPAENRVRGLLLFEMHAALAEFGRRQAKERVPEILAESRKILFEAYHLLRHEPEILPEGKIAIQARRNLRDMDTILRTLCRNTISPV